MRRQMSVFWDYRKRILCLPILAGENTDNYILIRTDLQAGDYASACFCLDYRAILFRLDKRYNAFGLVCGRYLEHGAEGLQGSARTGCKSHDLHEKNWDSCVDHVRV